VLRIHPRAPSLLGKCSTAELRAQSLKKS
jgi:hypothetical protein